METEAKLLVVVDDANVWSDAFGLPFRDATVVEGDGAWELEGAFDTVVVDRRGLDSRWLDRVASEVLPMLTPKARMLVALGGPTPAEAESPALPGLEWDGLVLLGDRPCAVLRRADVGGSVETGALVAAAHSAAAISEAGMARYRPRAQEIRRLLSASEADRRRSEQALLGQLAKAAAHSEQLSVELRRHVEAAAQPVTVKALLRSSPSGRRLLGILGRAKRLLRRRR